MQHQEQMQVIRKIREAQRGLDEARHVLARYPAARGIAQDLNAAAASVEGVITKMANPDVVAIITTTPESPAVARARERQAKFQRPANHLIPIPPDPAPAEIDGTEPTDTD